MSPAWPIWRQSEFLNGGGRIPQSLELKPLELTLSAGGEGGSTGFMLQPREGGRPVTMGPPVDTADRSPSRHRSVSLADGNPSGESGHLVAWLPQVRVFGACLCLS